MNGCWTKIWKECVNDFARFKVKDTSEVRKDIARLSHLAGFKEVNEDDIQELLDSHDEPLSNEDLMQLEQERAKTEDDDANQEEETVRGLDVKTLQEVFSSIEHAMELLKECDPNPARSDTAVHGVQQALKVYRDMYNSKKKLAKQTTISSFFNINNTY